MEWVQSCLDNDKLFPARVDVPFPKHFESVVKQIFKRLFRVYAHIYYSHFQKIVALGEEVGKKISFFFFFFFFFFFKFSNLKRRT